jgi:hypothetical protein
MIQYLKKNKIKSGYKILWMVSHEFKQYLSNFVERSDCKSI